MTDQLRTFYTNWLQKADSYTSSTLSDDFDKFTSLYVIFNALYSEAMSDMAISGKPIPKEAKDKRVATEYVAQYIGGKSFMDKLFNDQDSIECYEDICKIIEKETFHIILYWGSYDRKPDEKLLNSLRSTSKQEQAKAILTVFYHLRCNMFHGHKGFENEQKLLLVPVNKLLRKSVAMLYDKLSKGY